MLALLNTDGLTIVPVAAVASAHEIQTTSGVGTTDHGPANGKRDGNSVTTMLALSSDGLNTIVALYANAAGSLLIKFI